MLAPLYKPFFFPAASRLPLNSSASGNSFFAAEHSGQNAVSEMTRSAILSWQIEQTGAWISLFSSSKNTTFLLSVAGTGLSKAFHIHSSQNQRPHNRYFAGSPQAHIAIVLSSLTYGKINLIPLFTAVYFNPLILFSIYATPAIWHEGCFMVCFKLTFDNYKTRI